ncbi:MULTISPECIES: ABC transporter substrate-binding protein [unclassified Nocardioides]|uniref:ABC transporter substrate-binding protein n=1 Tax=unclassified Nocardioides TaxID=2615069 RepID=UPI0006F769A3|nr:MULTISPECIES: ABC transporter substrate-binding protein [unclassified Nocardioides]KQY56925.1 ABC transporter [Nocardioides sp. Root140]KRF13047.1 ABC transporter [Nocardioides sp. Soil796]
MSRPIRPWRLIAVAALFPLLALTGACDEAAAGPHLGLDEPLPTSAPKETKLVVGDPTTEVAFELSGQKDKFSFDIEFAQISGGPQTTEAFRAKALDVGAVADIPPIHAHWTGLDVKIVAAKYRQDPIEHPIYELGIKPGADVKTLEDLRGKKIAYSPGQAQGALILRVLEKAGLEQDDVKLVELPSTGDVYATALAAGEVDVAPLGSTQIKRYLANYGKDGATTIRHGLRDDPSHLYVLKSSLEDEYKAAAIREYVQRWAIAQKWIDEHPKEWLEGYYEKDQGLSKEDGEYLIKATGHPEIPTDWSQHITDHQATVDLLARETDQKEFDAAVLWDRRFEKLGGTAYETGKIS